MFFAVRQLVTAALTANALHPVPGYRAAVPAMAAGWPTDELAPHLAVLTAADVVRELTVGRRSRAGLALAAGSLAGLGLLIAESLRAQDRVERALVECLGRDYQDRLSATYTDLDLSTPLSQLAMPFRGDPDDVEVTRDVRYSDAGTRGLLDVYRQAGERPDRAPVLLQVHGGAWRIGSKDYQGLPLMRHMAARGWVCVAINYRLSPRDPFPAQIVDVKRAVAWLREHAADLGGDPGFVAVTGGSAGGHLASLAALTPNDPAYQPGFEDADTTVQAAAPHYGVYDFAAATGLRTARLMRDRFLAPGVLLKDFASASGEFEAASPLLRVGPDAPPFFVVHGDRDSLVDVRQARAFVAALRATSTQRVGYAELPGAQHSFDVFPSVRSAAVVRGVERFLRFVYDEWLADALADPSRPGDRAAR